MVILEELQLKKVVELYELKENSYRENAGGTALSCGYSEPIDCKEKIWGLFAKEGGAKQRLDSLVEQRIKEGYSKPNYVGGEQTRVEPGKEGKDNKIFCTSIRISPLEVNRQEITEEKGELRYKEALIE